MNHLVRAIIQQLEIELSTAALASQEAHDSATHKENISTNRYDTLALEAAYLAHGQSMRITELQQSIALYKHFSCPEFTPFSAIQLGALITIKDIQNQQHYYFLGPAAGGLKLTNQTKSIQVLNPSSPLGKALINRCIGDEVSLETQQGLQIFDIINIQ